MGEGRCRHRGTGPVRAGWRLVTLLALALPLAACGGGTGTGSTGSGGASAGGSSSPSAGLSLTDRATTVGVCAEIGRDVATAVRIGAGLATQTVTPADAQAQLQPVLTRVSAAATQHADLPVGPKLQQLADAITRAQQVTPTDVAALRTAATGVGTAGKDVVAACSGVAR